MAAWSSKARRAVAAPRARERGADFPYTQAVDSPLPPPHYRFMTLSLSSTGGRVTRLPRRHVPVLAALLLSAFAAPAAAQTGRIAGTVTDSSSAQPLLGVQ